MFINPRIGFRAIQVLSEAESVAELDFAISVINNGYPVIRGQIEIMECIRDGKPTVVAEDH